MGLVLTVFVLVALVGGVLVSLLVLVVLFLSLLVIQKKNVSMVVPIVLVFILFLVLTVFVLVILVGGVLVVLLLVLRVLVGNPKGKMCLWLSFLSCVCWLSCVSLC